VQCEIPVRFKNENLTECIDSLVEYIGKMQN